MSIVYSANESRFRFLGNIACYLSPSKDYTFAYIAWHIVITKASYHGQGMNKHYNEVTWASWRLKSSAVCLTVYLGCHQRKDQNPRYCPLWWESTGNRWITLTKGLQRGTRFHFMTSWYNIFTIGCGSRVLNWPFGRFLSYKTTVVI